MKEQLLELIKFKLDNKELDLSEVTDCHELHEALDYDGSVHELIDSNIEIYNYELRKWAVDNYDKVEDAIDEGLVDTTNFDFHKAIQCGQYIALREEANEALEEIFNELRENNNALQSNS